jgi:hypothetical protein
MVNMSLFLTHFSLGYQSASRKYRGLGHAVNRFVHVIKSRFKCAPLLNHNHPHVFDFRSHSMTVRSTKYMAPSFTDTLPTGACIPGVPPVGEGGAQQPRALA